jgi:hypothetical protein
LSWWEVWERNLAVKLASFVGFLDGSRCQTAAAALEEKRSSVHSIYSSLSLSLSQSPTLPLSFSLFLYLSLSLSLSKMHF